MPVKIAFSKQLEVDCVVDFRRFASHPFSFVRFYGQYTARLKLLCSVRALKFRVGLKSECVIKISNVHSVLQREWLNAVLWLWPLPPMPAYILIPCRQMY